MEQLTIFTDKEAQKAIIVVDANILRDLASACINYSVHWNNMSKEEETEKEKEVDRTISEEYNTYHDILYHAWVEITTL